MTESAPTTPTVDSAAHDEGIAALLAPYGPLKEKAAPTPEEEES